MNDGSDFSNTFHEESQSLLSEIESSVLDLESSPDNRDLIDSLFRAVHTLKGNSGMFGFEIIADIGHIMENVIGQMRDGALASGPDITDLFLSVVDVIRTIFEKGEAPGERVDEIKKELNSFYLKSTATTEKREDTEIAPAMEKEFNVFFRPLPNIFHLGLDPFSNLEELKELGECKINCVIKDVPDLFSINPEDSYIFWEIELKTSSHISEIQDVFLFVEDQSEISIEEKPEEKREVPFIKNDESYRTDNKEDNVAGKVSGYLGRHDSNITISTRKLDDMVNLIGELAMHQLRLSNEVMADEKSSLKEMITEMEESVEVLRGAILDLRMTPIGTKFGSFRRLVRDLSGSLGKKVELYTYGEDTELDKSIIEKMWDPLVHLIRNCIDHGIETPGDRDEAGKPSAGKIVVSARTKESGVEISISDDGRGIDPDVIYKKAVDKGLISPDKALAKEEIIDLIFLPGFSTSEKISDISGRGVGMDAVRQKVEEVNGEIRLDSVIGGGTTTIISLPLTLAIVDVLMVEAGNMIFAIPLGQIEECFELCDYKLKGERERHLLSIRDTYLPYFRLKDIFDLKSDYSESQDQVLVVQHGANRVGIVVDRLIRSQQAVIKSMRKWYKKNDGISGATVLGDGSLAYVLDILQVVRLGLVIQKKADFELKEDFGGVK